MEEFTIFCVALLTGLVIGYFLRDTVNSIRAALTKLSESVSSSLGAKEEQEEPKSAIVEALTPEQEAKQAMEARMKRVNK